jgi:type II secretory pathway component PulC
MINCALGIVAAVMLWSMLPHKPSVGPVLTATATPPQPDPTVVAQEVAMAHLFGQDATTASSAAPAAAANISVEGIIYSEDKDLALAILKMDGNSDIFRIGDTLPDGEKLLAIAPTAVEIGDHGAPRVLAMQQDFGDGGGGSLLAGIDGPPGRDNPFPSMQATMAPAAYIPALRPVLLSQNADPLSQLRSLRQQLIRQQPAKNPIPLAKHPAKP